MTLLGVVALAGAGAAPLRVGEVRLEVTDIYGPEEVAAADGLVGLARRVMNGVHPGTRHRVIRRELLFAPGDPLDESLLRETERNLRSLGFLTNVSIVPVDTLPDGTVDLAVRVQEVWSLTASANYSKASSGTRWAASLTDGNFLGHGVRLEAGAGADEDRDWRQLVFANRRLFGSANALRLVEADFSDGHVRSAALSRPWYSEEQDWGLEASAWDQAYEPRLYVDPARLGGAGERLYTNLPVSDQGFSAWVGRRVRGGAGRRIWRVGLGIWVQEHRDAAPAAVELSDGRIVSGDALLAAAGTGLALPRGIRRGPVIVVETLGRSWAAERFVRKLGPVEDLHLEPWMRLVAGPVLAAWGSDRERFVFDWLAHDWSRLGPGHFFVRSRGTGSLGSVRNRSFLTTLEGGWSVRSSGADLDLVSVEAGFAHNQPGDQVLALGLTRGLRTLEYDGRVGDRLLRWNAEHVRLIPGEILGFYRLGLAAFYAGGDAWWRGSGALDAVRHEFGLGLRFGPTRSARAEVARLDLAWPTSGGGPVLTAKTGGFF